MSKSSFFPGFLGNTKAVRALAKSIQASTIAHTLLFAGPPGSGKKTLAAAVAKRIFCPNQPCTCRDCTMMEKGIHPDFLLIRTDNDVVKLEHAKEVKTFLSTPPNSAPRKVAVLENCNKLTVEAANSLLKILEDPPARSICIMTADNSGNVLPTLVSRSQVYTLSPLPTTIIAQELKQKGLSDTQIEFLSLFSGGILGKALLLATEEEFWQLRLNLAMEIKEVIFRRKDPLLAAESWHEHPDASLDFVEYWLRDMLMLQTVPDSNPINKDFSETLKECVSICPEEKTISLLEHCAAARERLRARCNPRLVFDSLLLKMWEV